MPEGIGFQPQSLSIMPSLPLVIALLLLLLLLLLSLPFPLVFAAAAPNSLRVRVPWFLPWPQMALLLLLPPPWLLLLLPPWLLFNRASRARLSLNIKPELSVVDALQQQQHNNRPAWQTLTRLVFACSSPSCPQYCIQPGIT